MATINNQAEGVSYSMEKSHETTLFRRQSALLLDLFQTIGSNL